MITQPRVSSTRSNPVDYVLVRLSAFDAKHDKRLLLVLPLDASKHPVKRYTYPLPHLHHHVVQNKKPILKTLPFFAWKSLVIVVPPLKVCFIIPILQLFIGHTVKKINVETDGTWTRNFRRDKAVLLPIELQPLSVNKPDSVYIDKTSSRSCTYLSDFQQSTITCNSFTLTPVVLFDAFWKVVCNHL